MNRHLSFRSGNPNLSSKTFSDAKRVDDSRVMTLDGTVNKTIITFNIISVFCILYLF